MDVTPDMKRIYVGVGVDEKQYISVTVVNRGTAPTTITSFCGYYAKDHIPGLRKSNRKYFVVNDDPSLGNTVPYELHPGQQCSALVDQEKVIEDFGHGLFYIGVQHNQNSGPIYRKIKL
ncbi:MAG: hypothetical protein COA84_03755 [Robiginitomaculum sp.]|nr:MAG: hypothetical protein COA84_03755 [Robiginitomaculum sp.]